MRRKLLFSLVLSLLLIFIRPGIVLSEPLPDYQNFFDSFFEMNRVPGGVAVVVRGDDIVFARGYGYADIERAIPVSPERTLFRVGSISKLFTTVAILQLVEKGVLGLNESVDRYLDDPRARGITLTHLLTHTDGFDVGWGIGSLVKRERDRLALADVVRNRLPPRILPPGEIYLYGDVGMVVAGRIVEKVSGMSFERYVRDNILDPLDMRSSTFDQPLPSVLTARLAKGYQSRSGKYEARPFAYSNSVPAAAFTATSLDIARFLSANLREGRYSGQRILRASTVDLMHRIHFRHYPELWGSALGFYETIMNGKQLLEHSGRFNGYTSQLFLLPSENIGVFAAVNTNTPALANLLPNFLNAFYPGDSATVLPSKKIPIKIVRNGENLARFQGIYRSNRYPHSSINKLGAPLGEASEIRVKVAPDKTLTIGETNGWVEGAPGLFYGPRPDSIARFRSGDNGSPAYLFGNSPFSARERIHWYESSTLHFRAVIFLALCFFIICISELFYFVRSIKNRDFHIANLVIYLSTIKFSTAILNIIFIISLSLYLYFTDFWDLLDVVSPLLLISLAFPILSLATTIGIGILILYTWRKTRLRTKIYNLSTLSIFLLFLAILNYWNLLGYRL
jgi:CubicO group peptidase (beta-lactamase class C family)